MMGGGGQELHGHGHMLHACTYTPHYDIIIHDIVLKCQKETMQCYFKQVKFICEVCVCRRM